MHRDAGSTRRPAGGARRLRGDSQTERAVGDKAATACFNCHARSRLTSSAGTGRGSRSPAITCNAVMAATAVRCARAGAAPKPVAGGCDRFAVFKTPSGPISSATDRHGIPVPPALSAQTPDSVWVPPASSTFASPTMRTAPARRIHGRIDLRAACCVHCSQALAATRQCSSFLSSRSSATCHAPDRDRHDAGHAVLSLLR